LTWEALATVAKDQDEQDGDERQPTDDEQRQHRA
jgi:hypothetical protein